MTTTDWILDIVLIAVVFLQLREQRLGLRTFLLPVAIIGWAATQYLHGFPTAGNDVLLVAILTIVGAVFGLFSGLLTRVRQVNGQVYVRATLGAAALWVIGMGARMAFAVWTSSTSGKEHIASFSVSHDITSGEAWVVALLLMAFGQVLVRLAIVAIRGQVLASPAHATHSTHES
jgi:hypothetical protein